MSNKSKKWTLNVGIHDGTRMSRDVVGPTELDSLEECKAEVELKEARCASIGY